MADDLQYGTRNKRGDWSPNEPLHVGPLLAIPWNPVKILKWLPSYFLPWNAFFMALGVAWYITMPTQETMQTLGWGWVFYLLARNSALALVFFGSLELCLYVKRRQGNRFKYNGRFPADQPSDVFIFKSQNADNIIRTFGTGLPIWTAYEVLLMWAWANGHGPWTLFGDNPLWLIAFGVMIPLLHELHFFCIHRLIHWGPLYRWIHSVHHNSVNPSPWSSLSMHPVEHLLYWSGSLIHLILPSHPLLVLYHLHVAGTGAVVGHVGFDKVEAGEDAIVDTHAYSHYLHHKYFEVNYSDGMLPLDKWLGTWHDGTKEGEALMQARFEKNKARMNARKGGTTPTL